MPRRKTNAEFLEEIAGRSFIALEPYQTKRTKIQFRCSVPDCGHEWSAIPSNILSGKGCPRCARRYQIKKNAILATEGPYNLLDISTPTHPEAMMLCDKKTWERYSGGRVFAYAPDHGKYIYAGYTEGRRLKKFHHLVLTPVDGLETDHIQHGNMSYIDNTRSNLRICTSSENNMNKSLHSNNTSGVTGVGWRKASGKWEASIRVNYKQISLGYFQSKAEAITARKEAETLYFKQFAYSENN